MRLFQVREKRQLAFEFVMLRHVPRDIGKRYKTSTQKYESDIQSGNFGEFLPCAKSLLQFFNEFSRQIFPY
jgi:hypothetical protein